MYSRTVLELQVLKKSTIDLLFGNSSGSSIVHVKGDNVFL